jgi:hypothetical protein
MDVNIFIIVSWILIVLTGTFIAYTIFVESSNDSEESSTTFRMLFYSIAGISSALWVGYFVYGLILLLIGN